jgi:ribosomal protein L29
MKTKELNTFRSKKVEDLVSEVDKMRKEILNHQIGLKAGKAKKLKEVRNLKRDIAQILTIITEMELQAEITNIIKENKDVRTEETKKVLKKVVTKKGTK